MKKIIRTLFLVWIIIISPHIYATESCQHQVISGTVADTFYQDPASIVTSFRKSPFNTIATTVAWSVVEKEHGRIDLSMYYPRLDALTKAGYCLIVLLDTSGRSMRSDIAKLLVKNVGTIPQDSRPNWIDNVVPASNAVDFFGGLSPTMDFEDIQALDLVRGFYRAVLPRLRQRYGSKLIGVAPCITSECEVKYSQVGFRWQSYAPKSQEGFKRYLMASGLPPANMPMMNYGNHLVDGNPRQQPLYPRMQTFRELSLRNFVCTLTSEIRRAGIQSIGYFGQTFAFSDGIYATGIIERVADCFDVAAIDYNFFNGYGTENKPDVPRFLADYALALGYKKVLVGLYMERFRNPITLKIDPRGYGVLRTSMHNIDADSRILGIEIGNLTGDEFRQLSNYVKGEVLRVDKAPKIVPARRRIALYASVTNSYLWEGEWSNNRQILQDDLLATYTALKSINGIRVDIFTDEQARIHPWSLSGYDLVVLPHVTAMPSSAREALLSYLKRGGKVIADMRVDDYLPDGSLQKDEALHNALGIGATQAFEAINLIGAPSIVRQSQYVTGFVLAPRPGFIVAYRKVGGDGEGLIIRGKKTAVFGFLPLLVEGRARIWAYKQFELEVKRLIN